MSSQYVGGGGARLTDPQTSHDAAKALDSTVLESMVLEAIKKCPNGATGYELDKALPGFGIQTLTPRFAPLKRKGLIYDSGLRRPGASGRSQCVLMAVKGAQPL